MRIKRTDKNFTVRRKAGRKIHYAGQGKKYIGNIANFSPKEKQDALRQKNFSRADKGIQAQIQRPSAYHETSIKTKESVFHRKADIPFAIKRADGSSLKEPEGKGEKAQESKPAETSKAYRKKYEGEARQEKVAGNYPVNSTARATSASGYTRSFSDRRMEQIFRFKKKQFLQKENKKCRSQRASLQVRNNLSADDIDTSHIKKRNAGDSIRKRDGDIPDRKQQDKSGGTRDKKEKNDKGKNKDKRKDNKKDNSQNKGRSRKDRAAALRLLSYASNKFSQEEQKDSLLKTAGDLLLGKIKAVTVNMFLSIGAALLPVLIPAFIMVLIITLLFNSPFSILLPKLSEEPGAVEVLLEYTEDFREKVEEELADPERGDETELIYEDYEGDGEPDNMADILMVYMVSHGFGDTATVMTEKNKRALKDTFDEMTSLDITYRTEVREQSYEEEDFWGNITIKTEEVEVKVKEVRITLLTSEDMIRTGIFTEEETEILRYLMSPEALENIEGLTGGYGSPGRVSLTPEEEERLSLGGDTGSQAVKNALARLGKPYSQTERDSGDYYDCSSLTYYVYKEVGINLSYYGSNTAASQGKLLSDRGYEVVYEDIQPGDLIFYSFTRNGRYKNISHVAVYAGNGYLVDASSSKGCVVFRPVYSTGKIVMCGRPSWL